MTDLCALKGCDEPAQPPTFARSAKTYLYGTSAGGLGLCADHDRETTRLVRHRQQVIRRYNAEDVPSWLYFARCLSGKYEGLIKVGMTDSTWQRFDRLGSECQGKVEEILSTPSRRPVEGELHARFWHLWVTSEWYRPGEDLLACIEEYRKIEEERLWRVRFERQQETTG